MPHVRALKEPGPRGRIRVPLTLGYAPTWPLPETPIACIGFCMGGRVSFLTNSILPVKAAVSFYGGGIAPNPMGTGC